MKKTEETKNTEGIKRKELVKKIENSQTVQKGKKGISSVIFRKNLPGILFFVSAADFHGLGLLLAGIKVVFCQRCCDGAGRSGSYLCG